MNTRKETKQDQHERIEREKTKKALAIKLVNYLRGAPNLRLRVPGEGGVPDDEAVVL